MWRGTLRLGLLITPLIGLVLFPRPARGSAIAALREMDRVAEALSSADSVDFKCAARLDGTTGPATYFVHATVHRPDQLRMTISDKAYDDTDAAVIVANSTGLYEYDPERNVYSVSPPGGRLHVNDDILHADFLLEEARQFLGGKPYRDLLPDTTDSPLRLTRSHLDLAGTVLLTANLPSQAHEQKLAKLWVDTAADTPRRFTISILREGVELETYDEEFQTYTLNPKCSMDFTWATPKDATPATLSVRAASSAPDVNGFSDEDIGSPGQSGASAFLNGGYIVRSGGDISVTSDSFHFVHKRMTGIISITARVIGLTQVDLMTKAGVMLRGGLAPDDANVAVLVRAPDTITIQARTAKGAQTLSTGMPKMPFPVWVRLTRVGDMVSGYASHDGVRWFLVGQYLCSLGNYVQAGLAAAAANDSRLTVAGFDNVSTTGVVAAR